MAHVGRSMKNPEAPRPLKSQSRASLKNNYMLIEELIQLIENVAITLQSGVSSTEPMATLVQNLRVHGPQLESVSKDTLDRAFVVFRNASQDERLNIMTRLNLLELIELRAKGWSDNGLNSYYKTKHVTNELPDNQHQVDQMGYISTSPTFGASMGGAAVAAAAVIGNVGSAQQQQLLLGPGEVLRNSGKFSKPTKIPGKTYCKDEVVIRNADSGKVMGIKGRRVHMIEELSETIISFQRVNPGAKERLVQITGPTEDKINYAKQLIEDTIRRNASPVRLDPAVGGAGSCSSLASSNSDEGSPRIPGNSGSNLANRLSFNSSKNFMTGQQAAAQQQLGNIMTTVPNNMSNTNISAGTAKLMRPNAQILLHSYSTNDASLGEYKYTVNVGQHIIKITGDCCEFVQVAKLVLDDYFSSADFLASFEEGVISDGTLVSPIVTPGTPIGAPQFTLGNTSQHGPQAQLVDGGVKYNYMLGQLSNNVHEGDDEVFTSANGLANSNLTSNSLSRSRRSHFSRKDSTTEQTSNNMASRKKSETAIAGDNGTKNSTRISHEYEHLLYYAKSPHAWAFPSDWQKICEKCPSIIRNKDLQDESGRFNGETYLELVKSGSKRNFMTAEEAINDFDEQENE
ncbi:eukaryotic translation initiation factor 4E-binding protein Mextli [Teleopsis dalmanni]|uniref:eukaryotic translation initiation factor 4E-binding protein Mextli n=1 Tax=Teleopsis dalmanni TaxID=139649 RepID=UPI0018CCCAED|nr:eukaryotic translation initiation factor 4E-binding protein Mextli [Teleopsis dalmanni]XP_037960459.1 eukaryotic translation initiation factor 4E-binding protein Mextli [Teleopsis dalmanni]XP_037960461.1 eukaryotic translation initiation factor 4E-binding protein Mextli [Teleopsis dalmanni]